MNIKVVLCVCLLSMLIACIVVGNVSAWQYEDYYDTGDCIHYTTTAGEWNDNAYDYYPPFDITGDFEHSFDIVYTDSSNYMMVRLELNGITAPYYWMFLLHDDASHTIQWASNYTEAYTDGAGYSHTIKTVRSGNTVSIYCDGALKDSVVFTGAIHKIRINALNRDGHGYTNPAYSNMYLFYSSDDVPTITANEEYNYIPFTARFYDYVPGFTGLPYTIRYDDGTIATGYTTSSNEEFIHIYTDVGNYNVSYTVIDGATNYTSYAPVSAIEDTTCAYDISLSLSKTSSITPLSEYITMNAEIIGTPELIPGSSIGYYFGSGSGGTVSPTHVATFTNTTNGLWLYNRNDLGITSSGFTTYEDILSEQIRFPDAGNYVVRFAVVPYGSCSKYVDKYVSVNPSSQVNLDIYFKDGITYNMIPSVTSAISIVNVTGNTTYSGNPIGIATQIGQNVSIYATAEGYTPKHIYYTIPSSVYGNTLDIPFFMFPTDYGEYYPDNTTWTITVKSLTSGENLYGASVGASDSTGTIDEGYTNSDGYVTLFVPFRDSPVRLDVAKVPYISSSQWVNLGNATEYATTVYLNYGGTPTPTPSYNYTYTVTPTQTDTPIPTVTQITNPMLTVWVRDAITNLPIGDAYVYIYDGDEIDQTYKGSLIYSSTTDSVQGATPKLQMIANNAYWVVVSKSGYYTLEKRFRMSSQDASIFAPLQPSHGVTIATTQPTLVLPTPGGTGIQGGFIGWILDYFSEWFGVDNGTARILLALFIIMCSSVFVGGSLAGFGSGAGAGMGALIGGMFAFIAMCYVQFLPFWLLPIGIAFVGMAFFVWNRQEK